MTITTELLANRKFLNSTATVNFSLTSNNGVIRIVSNTGTSTLLKDNGSGTYLTYATVLVGESKEAINCFVGNYRITGTDFNYEYAD